MCILRECDGARLTAMLVWGMDEVWLWLVQGMWMIHMVQVLCLVGREPKSGSHQVVATFLRQLDFFTLV